MPFGLSVPKGGFAAESPQSQQLIGELKQEQARSDQAIQQATEDKQKAVQDYTQEAGKYQGLTQEYLSKVQPVPQFQPRQMDQGAAMAFATIATALAGIGTKAMRGDLTMALSTSAAAMKGYQEGNLVQAREDRENFERQMRSVIAQNNQLTAQYQAIMEDRKLSLQQKMQAISIKAQERGDTIAIAAMREGRIQDLLHRNDAIAAGTKQMEFTLKVMQNQMAMLDKRMSAQIEAAKARFGGGMGGGGGMSPEAIDQFAHNFIFTGRMPIGFARIGQAAQTAVANRVAEIGQSVGMTPEDLAAAPLVTRQKLGALMQFEKNRAAIQSYEKMLDLNIDILKELSTKVDRTDSPYANRPILWLKNNAAGDPDVSEYLFQVNTVATEVARVLNNPNMTGQLTDTARQELEGVISGNLNPKQLDQVLNRAQADARNRAKSMDDQANKLISEIRNPLGKGGGAPNLPSQDAINAELKRRGLQ